LSAEREISCPPTGTSRCPLTLRSAISLAQSGRGLLGLAVDVDQGGDGDGLRALRGELSCFHLRLRVNRPGSEPVGCRGGEAGVVLTPTLPECRTEMRSDVRRASVRVRRGHLTSFSLPPSAPGQPSKEATATPDSRRLRRSRHRCANTITRPWLVQPSSLELASCASPSGRRRTNSFPSIRGGHSNPASSW
jgi:hypothetical protein